MMDQAETQQGANVSKFRLLFSDKTPKGISQKQLEARYSAWEWRTIIVCLLGYATFYLVRKNFSIAIPDMKEGLGLSGTDIGLILTLQGIIYGVSKFFHGFVGDRVNARIFMVSALTMTAVANIIFGVTGLVVNMFAVFAVIWSINGWIQGMGVAPCNKMLANWVPPSELATKMSIWNTAHSVGAGGALVICGVFILPYLGWQACFWLPGIIALGGAVFIWFGIRDTPESVGLPHPKIEGNEELANDEPMSKKEFRDFIIKHVFKNKIVWIVTIANFFIYSVRFSFLDWGYTILQGWKGLSEGEAVTIVTCFELTGIAGMVVWGFVTDKFFAGLGIRVSLLCMLFTCIFLLPLLVVPGLGFWSVLILVSLIGLFMYGPQTLVGIVAINHATKKAAATAIGLTGIFAYASTIVSGIGIGMIETHYGWDAAMWVVLGLAMIGALVFALGWFAPANAYNEPENKK